MRKRTSRFCVKIVTQGKQKMNAVAKTKHTQTLLESDNTSIDNSAEDLFELFVHYSVDKSGVLLVSEEGLFEMSNYFETVPEEDRGYVFLSFLSMLYEEDYRYDMQQFLQMDEIGNNEVFIN